MPNLNLKDDEVVHEEPMAPRLRKRDEGTQSKGTTLVLLIVLIIAILAGITFLLNQYGVIKLWGSKTVAVKRVAPPVAPVDTMAAAVETSGKGAAEKETMKKPEGKKAKALKAAPAAAAPKEKKTIAAPAPAQQAANGEYAVQISSWPEEEKANSHANQLREGGLDAYVVKAGDRWTVRVGKYASHQQAREEAKRLGENAESRVIVVRAQ